MNKIRLGIIGPGLIWEGQHKPVLKKLEDKFEIAAFCATSDKSKHKINKEYPVMPFYKDYKALLRESFIDAVVILTPITLNPVIALAALDAGKDVFMEKPMATNVKEAKELVKREKETGKQVFILEQFVYKSYTDEILKIINSGRLGDILIFEKAFHGYIGHKEGREDYGNTEWRINPKYPLGMLFDGGIHEIAMLSKIFGRPLCVYAAGSKYRQDGYGDYDYESMVFGYKNNLIGTFNNSYYLDGQRNYFIIRGTKGLVFYEEGLEITVEENSGRKDVIKLKDENPYYNMWKDFVNCLETNSKPYYTTEKALSDLQILEAIKQSLENGTRIKVDFSG
jgi:scyllo-inositol 2-dehydrogenase (NADP+)